jgi:DNA polymerase-3 subunit epsilon
MTFASIDFETANYSDASICAAGLAVIEDGNFAESPYWLVRPPKGCGWFREDFTEIHGLTWFDVQDAPEFSAIASEFLERLTRADIVVAHNASFDMRKLRGTLQHFGLACPEFDYACTLKLSRRVWPDLPSHGLETVARHIGLEFQHHHAQADAEAAGRVLLAMMQHANVNSPRELLQKTGVSPERFLPYGEEPVRSNRIVPS